MYIVFKVSNGTKDFACFKKPIPLETLGEIVLTFVGETNNLKPGDRFNHKSLRLERTRSNVVLEFRLRRISISNLSNGVHR